MYDWIIEADIYRLNKAAGQTSRGEEPRNLETFADAKAQVLAAQRREASALTAF
jgi:hypothetical protein